jgi:hypothetical protein
MPASDIAASLFADAETAMVNPRPMITMIITLSHDLFMGCLHSL